MSLKAL